MDQSLKNFWVRVLKIIYTLDERRPFNVNDFDRWKPDAGDGKEYNDDDIDLQVFIETLNILQPKRDMKKTPGIIALGVTGIVEAVARADPTVEQVFNQDVRTTYTYEEVVEAGIRPGGNPNNIRNIFAPSIDNQAVVRRMNNAILSQLYQDEDTHYYEDAHYYEVDGLYYFIPDAFLIYDQDERVRVMAALILDAMRDTYQHFEGGDIGDDRTNIIATINNAVEIITNIDNRRREEEQGNDSRIKSARRSVVPILDVEDPEPPNENNDAINLVQPVAEVAVATVNDVLNQAENTQPQYFTQRIMGNIYGAYVATGEFVDQTIQANEVNLLANQNIVEEVIQDPNIRFIADFISNIGGDFIGITRPENDREPGPPNNESILDIANDLNRSALDGTNMDKESGRLSDETIRKTDRLYGMVTSSMSMDIGFSYSNILNNEVVKNLIISFTAEALGVIFRGTSNVLPATNLISYFKPLANYSVDAVTNLFKTYIQSATTISGILYQDNGKIYNSAIYIATIITAKIQQIAIMLGLLTEKLVNDTSFYVEKGKLIGNQYNFVFDSNEFGQFYPTPLYTGGINSMILGNKWKNNINVESVKPVAYFDSYRYSVISEVTSKALDIDNSRVLQPTYEIIDNVGISYAIDDAVYKPSTQSFNNLAEKVNSWVRVNYVALQNHILDPLGGGPPDDFGDDDDDMKASSGPSDIPKVPKREPKIYTEEGFRYIWTSLSYFITKHISITIATAALSAYISCKIINGILSSANLPVPQIALVGCTSVEKILVNALTALGMAADIIKNLIATVDNLALAAYSVTQGVGGIIILGLLAAFGIYSFTR